MSRAFIALRANSYTRPGWYWMGGDDPDMLYRAQLIAGAKGTLLTQTSQIGVPFDFLAPVIVEMNFRISQKELDRGKPNMQHELDANRQFKKDFEDIIEPEVEERIQKAEPSYKSKSGVIVPAHIKKDKNAKSKGKG